MASGKKQIQLLARQFFKLSVVDGSLSADRVSGVLAYVEKHRPAHAIAVLKAYSRLVSAEVARGRAVVEHAGSIQDSVLATIAAAMAKKYSRPIASVAKRNDALLAGLRVRVGDDVYESSVSGQLATLAAAV
ncbi:MAG: F0F1 ATP synthase subunit delta [Opitutaceae bacterium]